MDDKLETNDPSTHAADTGAPKIVTAPSNQLGRDRCEPTLTMTWRCPTRTTQLVIRRPVPHHTRDHMPDTITRR